MNEEKPKKSFVAMIVLLVLHAICGAVAIWLLTILVPKYERIFRDFNTQLPDVSVAVINGSILLARFWYVLVPGICAGDFAIVFSLYRAKRFGLMVTYGAFAWLAEMLLIGSIMFAMLTPLNELVISLSSGK